LSSPAEKTLLRFATAGSVDDGKSTLIGRLLYETRSIPEDQYRAAEKTSRRRGQTEVDLSLLLDGLAAEREQGITIDVAYRYFSTPKRKFIIADVPGHEQYTRNMVTGASTADLAVILIDARNGVLTQSRRHGFLASLLGIPHLIVAVNKMDLAGYSQEVFRQIMEEYEVFSQKLGIHDIAFIPVSALKGDNVAQKSTSMPWYDGPTLLHVLDNVHVAADRNLVDFRFPVQNVIRPHQDFRGYAGRVATGTIAPGEEIAVLPSGRTSKVKSIVTYDGDLSAAFAGQAVTLTLADEIDISRGDMIVRRSNLPQAADELDATICWMTETPSNKGTRYILKHTTRITRAFVSEIHYRIDVNTLHRQPAQSFGLNEIGRVLLKTSHALFFDPYRTNRETGSFILIDPLTNATVAAGIIRGVPGSLDAEMAGYDRSRAVHKSPHVVWSGPNVPQQAREERNGHKAAVLWLTGYSGSGKSTIARRLEQQLFQSGVCTMLLDGDNVRHGLCSDLGFSDEDRAENIRRVAETARLFFENGHVVICTFISPFRKDRDFARSLMPAGRFIEIHVKCDLELCKQRDPKGLYKKAAAGEIREFTGVTSPYEEPKMPELVVETDLQTVDEIAGRIRAMLEEHHIVNG